MLRSPSGPEQVHPGEDVAGTDEAPTLARRPGKTALGNRQWGCGAGLVYRRLYGPLFCWCFSARRRIVLLQNAEHKPPPHVSPV